MGVVVAQGVLMGHAAYYDYSDSVKGQQVASNPALVMATAVVTAALAAALCISEWLPRARQFRAAVVTAVPSLALCGAAAELLTSTTLVSLWAASIAMTAKTLRRLQRNDGPPVWVASNGAVLALGCFCLLVWATAVAVAASALVREARAWWARRVAAAEVAGTSMASDIRLALLVVACLLAIGVLPAQATFMRKRLSDYYTWQRGKDVAAAPALVIVSAVAALVTAATMLLGHFAVHSLRARDLLDGVKAAVPPEQVAAAEAGLAACVLCLWVASMGVSARTAHILRRYNSKSWTRCNAAVLALECIGVLVWAAVFTLSVQPVARVARALSARWSAPGGAYQRLDASEQAADAGHSDDDKSDSSSGAAPTSRTPAAFQLAHLGLYLLGLLLAIGVLVAQIVMFDHSAWVYSVSGSVYSSNNWVYAKGKRAATAPVLVLVTAAVTIAGAGVKLLAALLKAMRPGACGASPTRALVAACVETELAVLVWFLWVVCVGLAGKTASTLAKDPYRQSRVWVHSSRAVLVMASITVAVWGAALALSFVALRRMVWAWLPPPAVVADVEADQPAAIDGGRTAA